MRQAARLLLVAIIIAGLVAGLTGCGGQTSTASMSPSPSVTSLRIAEYVGDGHNGAKPLPGFTGLAGDLVQPQALAQIVIYNREPIFTQVPAKHIYWFRLAAVSVASKAVVITLQPTANEDSDLYVLQGDGATYDTGAGLLGYSNRLPVPPTPDTPDGLAPDWVPLNLLNTNGLPAAQIAVYGVPTSIDPPPLKHFFIEANPALPLTVNGRTKSDTIPTLNSRWYRFAATAGKQYTVKVGVYTGNPDLYVYENASTKFVGKDDTHLPGTVQFTAQHSVYHYIRVIGMGISNHYNVKVTSP